MLFANYLDRLEYQNHSSPQSPPPDRSKNENQTSPPFPASKETILDFAFETRGERRNVEVAWKGENLRQLMTFPADHLPASYDRRGSGNSCGWTTVKQKVEVIIHKLSNAWPLVSSAAPPKRVLKLFYLWNFHGRVLLPPANPCLI